MLKTSKVENYQILDLDRVQSLLYKSLKKQLLAKKTDLINLDQFLDQVKDKLGLEKTTLLRLIENDEKIFLDREKNLISLREIIDSLEFIYQKLFELNQNRRTIDFAKSKKILKRINYRLRQNNIELSYEQFEFLKNFIERPDRVFLLSGSAGCGKTFLLSLIYQTLLLSRIKPSEIVFCSYTGRAADVIKNAIDFRYVNSRTIHSLLSLKPNSKKPLIEKIKQKVIVIDEMSMVDLLLFEKILRKLDRDHILILVGDTEQLPCLGYSKIFQSLIESKKFFHLELKTIKRQKSFSKIFHFSQFVRKGFTYLSDSAFRPDLKNLSKSDLMIFDVDLRLSNSNYEDRLILLTKKILESLLNSKEISLSTIKNDLTILVYRRKLARKINQLVRQILIKHEKKIKDFDEKTLEKFVENEFSESDRIINLKNLYVDAVDKSIANEKFENLNEIFDRRETSEIIRVFNGQIGHVFKIEDDFVFLEFDQKIIRYRKKDFRKLFDLSYAITVHKSQGSSYEYVICLVEKKCQDFLNRRWFYTAITRAKKQLFVVGSKKLIEKMIENHNQADIDHDSSRIDYFQTYLKSKLEERSEIEKKPFHLKIDFSF